ncbi:hypothetical protein M3Y94_00642200 [Aphelenchoides besseyi]|nr:hypothetical protein M3Y94_00642200 [Aphelenchoides besseyi]KAI6231034.1 hypothetical protein M3Y95_00338900 [Aphelenchoides besseyi]
MESVETTCTRGHAINRLLKKKLVLFGLESFLAAKESMIESRKAVMSMGPFFLYFTLQSLGCRNKAVVYLNCDGSDNFDDFECSVWATQDGHHVGGNPFQTVPLHYGYLTVFSGQRPVNLFLKVYYKGECPLCIREDEISIMNGPREGVCPWQIKALELKQQLIDEMKETQQIELEGIQLKDEYNAMLHEYTKLSAQANYPNAN